MSLGRRNVPVIYVFLVISVIAWGFVTSALYQTPPPPSNQGTGTENQPVEPDPAATFYLSLLNAKILVPPEVAPWHRTAFSSVLTREKLALLLGAALRVPSGWQAPSLPGRGEGETASELLARVVGLGLVPVSGESFPPTPAAPVTLEELWVALSRYAVVTSADLHPPRVLAGSPLVFPSQTVFPSLEQPDPLRRQVTATVGDAYRTLAGMTGWQWDRPVLAAAIAAGRLPGGPDPFASRETGKTPEDPPPGDQGAAPQAPERPDPVTGTRPEPPPPIKPVTGNPQVLAYYPVDWPGDLRALNALKQFHQFIDGVGAFLFRVDSRGKLHGEHDGNLMDFATARNLPVYAVIHNYSDGRFDSGVVRGILENRKVMRQFIANALQLLRDGGYRGLNLDLEKIPPSLRGAYSSMVAELGRELRAAGFSLSLALPAKTNDDPGHGWSGGFDYAALGRAADQVVIMAYDEHWAGGPPGPIASLGWVEDTLRYATREIPARKILLGIAGYAYDWPEDGWARALSVGEALDRARRYQATVKWDAGASAPYYTYSAEGVRHTVYFENAVSTRFKLDLAKRYGVGGVTVWRLGLEDGAIWPLIGQRHDSP